MRESKFKIEFTSEEQNEAFIVLSKEYMENLELKTNCKDTPCMFALEKLRVIKPERFASEYCLQFGAEMNGVDFSKGVKDDKMEEVRVVMKLEDLDGLDNGMGLRVVASDVSDFKDYKNISVSVYKGDCRIADIKGPAKKKLETLKSMGFKAEYKPLRTKEEVIAEMTAKTDNIFKEDRNYDLYEVEFIKFTKHYKIRLAETVGAPVFVAGLAQKYADELNEILKNN